MHRYEKAGRIEGLRPSYQPMIRSAPSKGDLRATHFGRYASMSGCGTCCSQAPPRGTTALCTTPRCLDSILLSPRAESKPIEYTDDRSKRAAAMCRPACALYSAGVVIEHGASASCGGPAQRDAVRWSHEVVLHACRCRGLSPRSAPRARRARRLLSARGAPEAAPSIWAHGMGVP